MSSQESASHVNVRQRGSRKHASNGSTPAVAPIEPPAEPTNEQPQASSSSSPSQQYKVFLSPNGLNLGEVVDPRAEFVGAIDQGTSSTRFVLFDRQGRIVRAAQQELPQIHTTGKPGSVHEHIDTQPNALSLQEHAAGRDNSVAIVAN